MIDARFYVCVINTNPPLWAKMDANHVTLTHEVLHAEAFPLELVETVRQAIINANTHLAIDCQPIECSSQRIIPDHLRKLINIE